ncbi:VanZ family protein [Cytobacillus purgationiresistens]|uniref:Glycopeptide antibiotics resistance protein n=1 Tax=Cytobacillus purgationiresistens TaxID=863449 RepID=A0ABU0AIB2_9BACI|nr:VanZ family protein [Cytobacillus purgationiresistens]MDQ0270634.1 glycopeptide antibiotics resistance protein [Cytobacillus purgationiresistens]
MSKGIFKFLFWSMIVFYIFLIVELLFLSRGGYRNVNLVPFETITSYINVDNGIRRKLVDVNVWGNILMFVPAGMYLMIFNKGEFLKTLLIICGLSIAAETIQYIFAIGATDIDDVILNTFGGFIGILIYLVLAKIFKSEHRIKKFIAAISGLVGIPVLIIAIIVTIVNW